MKKYVLAAMLSLSALALGASAVTASVGDLDLSFGEEGIFSRDFGGDESLESVVLQPDGKILLSSVQAFGDGGFGLLVSRLNADGSLDASFGENGIATFRSLVPLWSARLLLQPDGKIVVVGTIVAEGDNYSNVYALRFSSTGELDPTFAGGPNMLVIDDPEPEELVNDAALLSDGRILLIGNRGPWDQSKVFLYYFDSEGRFDRTYNGTAQAAWFFDSQNFANSLVALADGKILLGGWTSGGGGPNDISVFSLFRFGADGRPDPNFGTGGLVTLPLEQGASVHKIQVSGDGRILAVGIIARQDSGAIEIVAARFLSNGSLDPSFGEGGKVFLDVGNYYVGISGIAVQNDGKILLSGFRQAAPVMPGPPAASQAILLQLNENGSKDASFGIGGIQILPLNLIASSSALLSLADGKILSAGTHAVSSQDHDVWVAKFSAEAPPSEPVANSGSCSVALNAGSGGGPVFVACAVFLITALGFRRRA